jgi:hypothetical protein
MIDAKFFIKPKTEIDARCLECLRSDTLGLLLITTVWIGDEL